MTEQELIAELHRLADECERLSRKIASALQQQRFSRTSDATKAVQDEQGLLGEMNRVMDRRRAVEGHLRRVRGQLRPLKLDD